MGNDKNKYFAFISYKREDEDWAVWFHHELENYHLPDKLSDRGDLPTNFRPVFRDVDELKAGNLPEQIYDALSSSTYLVVICSPKATQSEWVNKEIQEFIEIGKSKGVDNINNIFPFIVEGYPYSQNANDECFPDALRDLPKNKRRMGGNVNENGRDNAFVKVIAGMLDNIAFDDLWNRYERCKAEEERLKREERDRFLCMQSRFVAEKALAINDNSSVARRLALEILPKDLAAPNRPYTIEAERALRQSLIRTQMTLSGHNYNVPDIAFTTDAKMMASISSDFSIRIWDTDTGKLIRRISTQHPFGNCITFSPDNKSVFAVFGDHIMVMWEVETGDILNSWDLNKLDIPKGVQEIVFDPMFRQVVLVEFGGIHIISFQSGEVLSCEIDNPSSVAFSPDGRYLASVSNEGIDFWDFVEDESAKMRLSEGLEVQFSQISFSSDGKRVVFFCDCIIGLLDVMEGGEVQTFGKIDTFYKGVSFCNNDKHIASVSDEGILIIWDVQTLTEVAANYDEIYDVDKVVFAPEGNLVGVVSEKKNIVVKSIISPFVDKIFKKKDCMIGKVSYSPDEKYIVASNLNEPFDLSVWNVETEQVEFELLGHEERVFAVEYSSDGKLIASCSYDKSIRIWDAQNGSCLKVLVATNVGDDSRTALCSLAFSPDNKYISCGSYNGYVIVWDIQTEQIVKVLKDSGPVWCVLFSPNGERIVSAGINQIINVWNIGDGNKIMTLEAHTDCIKSVVYSPDGLYILSASQDKTLICWDAQKGDIVWRIMNISRPITSLAVDDKGKYVVATSEDVKHQLFVCDIKSGGILVSFHGLAIQAGSVAISSNGRHIVSGGIDGTITIWNFAPLQELIDDTVKRYDGKSLQSEERVKYYLDI